MTPFWLLELSEKTGVVGYVADDSCCRGIGEDLSEDVIQTPFRFAPSAFEDKLGLMVDDRTDYLCVEVAGWQLHEVTFIDLITLVVIDAGELTY